MRASLVLALLAAAPAARASVYDEFFGLRSQAMGSAHRGLGSSNDTLFLNPAAMVMVKRYSIDLAYGYTALDGISHLSLSAVDSKSGPVAGAAAYTHDRGGEGIDARIHRIYMAAAYPIFQNFAFGVTVKNLRGDHNGAVKTNAYNGDLGLMLLASEGLGIGVTYHNVLKADDDESERFLPPRLGAGVGYQYGELALAADVVLDLTDPDNRQPSYHVGAEYFLYQQYPVRLGWQLAPFTRKSGKRDNENTVSGGIGWINQGGALEVTFAQSIERQRNWALTGALKFFL